MKIVTIVGARPQFIKAAAVSREIAKHSEITEIIVHTGQHFDSNMSEIFFREMEIPSPHYCLEVHSLGHGAMTGRMLEKIEEVLIAEQPDYVLVYGDTNSTLAGALAAKKLHIRVVHVEAGLRSHNLLMPEEINRILTDRISDLLCCPSAQAVANLKQEGFDTFPSVVVKTGDVMLDAALYYKALSAERSDVIVRLGLTNREFVLCTVHRAENTDNPTALGGILSALNDLAQEMPVVVPLHPRTRKIINAGSFNLAFEPIDPVGYFDMIELLSHAKLVMTDSGGLQKEAFFFRKPCVTLRQETEWVELVEAGVNVLAGSNRADIVRNSHDILAKEISFDQNFYGSGLASREIVNALLVVNK